MSTFKKIRSSALETVKTTKVFADKKSTDNQKDDAFSKKGKVATSDGKETQYDVENNPVKVTEDIDQAYSDWQQEIKDRNPEHADKIKFKSPKDQRHVISAEHNDRSFGTFDMNTGKGEHLGEAFEYRGKHLAPNGTNDVSAPLHDLTKVYPDDVYGAMAHRFYGHGGDAVAMDKQTTKIAQSFRNKPEKLVDIYRAVPTGISKPKINHGDWVTINKEYAKYHGQSQFGDDHQILHKQVPAKHVFSSGDSIHEYGYDKSEQTNESVINEVSKSTLLSYIQKAAMSATGAASEAGFKAGRKQPKYNVADETETEKKRLRGIATASKKLANEDVTMTGSLDQDYVAGKLEKIAKKHGVGSKELRQQLDMGLEVEKEHTDDMDVATKIALDHLDEKPNYYTKLKAVEEATDAELYQLHDKKVAEVRLAAHNDGIKFAPKADQIEIRGNDAIAKGHDFRHHVYHHDGKEWKKDNTFVPSSYSDALNHLYGTLNTKTGKREPK